jgi:site-specific recombinase XerD
MSKKDAKTDSIRKENACSIHVQNTIQAHRRKLEEPKKIIEKQRKKGTNSIRKENTCSIHAQNTLRAYRRKLEEQKNILEKQRKEEILKIMEEKRYPKKEDRNPKKEDVLCSICGKMMRANSMSVSIFKIYN